MLPPDKVLVTIGTPCTMSAVGSTESFLARVRGTPDFVMYAAFDADLVTLDLGADGTVDARWPDGSPAPLADIEKLHGDDLRANLGIRVIDELVAHDEPAVTDVAAPLPHDLGTGGLRAMAGITFREVRDSAIRDMHALFDDDPRLGPSLQSQLFVYAGLGALAALPRPAGRSVDGPVRVPRRRVGGVRRSRRHRRVAQPRPRRRRRRPADKFAARLASSLSSHGPALSRRCSLRRTR